MFWNGDIPLELSTKNIYFSTKSFTMIKLIYSNNLILENYSLLYSLKLLVRNILPWWNIENETIAFAIPIPCPLNKVIILSDFLLNKI